MGAICAEWGLFHLLTDFIYTYVEKYASTIRGNTKCRKYTDKDILACILFLQAHRTRELKHHGICYSTVYERIKRWNDASVLQSALRDMQNDYCIECLQKDKFHNKNLIIDTSFIKNVQGRDCVGKNSSDRGRKATKLSVITDKEGMPLAYSIHAGNCADISVALNTVDSLSSCLLKSDNRIKTNLLADKAYSCVYGHTFRRTSSTKGFRLVVHPKANFRNKYISFKTTYVNAY